MFLFGLMCFFGHYLIHHALPDSYKFLVTLIEAEQREAFLLVLCILQICTVSSDIALKLGEVYDLESRIVHVLFILLLFLVVLTTLDLPGLIDLASGTKITGVPC
ncbi:hypothetical protein BJY00DRAFT_241903 [Aspergillus carlsbadensis]|nr:hypothetical protein BJY00DRAFT_241903 [Aspergillus carlsbadensis]